MGKTKIWRTLLRIEDIDESYVYLVIPAWEPKEVVRLRLDDIPDHIQKCFGQQARLHARVNIGAESAEHLRFDAWESE